MDKSDLNKIKNIYMIGIGGISMSGIAIMLKKAGFNVSGSDMTYGDMIDILKSENIDVFIGSNENNVVNADIVVYTAAIDKKTDKEYLKSVKLGIPTFERAPFLGSFLHKYDKPICVAGMHGKTTTTSIISSILKGINANPTVLVGSKLRELDNLNYMVGDNKYFVLESCEYVDSFLNFSGDTSVVLNIEEDHLDYFANIEAIRKSFAKFLLLTHDNGNVVINKDNDNCMIVLNTVLPTLKERNIKICTFSLKDNNCNIYANNLKLNDRNCYDFDLYINNEKICTVSLNAPGKHNVLNSLAAIGTMYVNDIDIISCIPYLEEFTGASRRFEYKKTINDTVRVYDDYAHHPTEIKTTLATAREKNPDRIFAIFEPHTYSRTKALFDEFVNAFDDADVIIITKIYAAREVDDGTISGKILADALVKKGKNALYIDNFSDIAKYIKENSYANDIVLTMGAGNVTKISGLL